MTKQLKLDLSNRNMKHNVKLPTGRIVKLSAREYRLHQYLITTDWDVKEIAKVMHADNLPSIRTAVNRIYHKLGCVNGRTSLLFREIMEYRREYVKLCQNQNSHSLPTQLNLPLSEIVQNSGI